MTPLGLSSAELSRALGRYRLRVDTLIRAASSDRPMNVYNEALPVLGDLEAMIEVDIGARSESIGQARMSEVERRVLVPLLMRLERRITGLGPSLPSRDWLPILHEADEDVARAERALARH